MAINDTDYDETTTTGDKEPATKHDVTEGGVLGAVGGAVVGMLAGGPLGAVIGAVAGGAASAAAVDVVDKHDHDYARTADSGAGITGTGLGTDTTSTGAYGTTPAGTGDYNTSAYDTTAATTAAPLTGTNTGLAGDQVVVPVVEEELAVGKRQVQGGGVRVHTDVLETPVEEQVTLHDEHVTVDRRPVDRAVTGADQAFQEGVIELQETSEVPVVAKTARVVEEVVVGKTATDHTETIRDTVKRTDVQVDELDSTNLTGTRRDI